PEWAFYDSVPAGPPVRLGFPLIVKPAAEDASLGILEDAVVRDFPGLCRNCRRLLEQYPRDGVLVEKFIPGREFNVALLPDGGGVKALPPSEIDFSGLEPGADQVVSYKAKWVEDDALYRATPSRCPADVPGDLKARLQDTAVRVHCALGADAYGRVDFRVDGDGRVYVLEYNPNPDISPGAGFCKALQADGWSYPEFVKAVMQAALARRRNA
ncbi:MAG: D-alanine--D-alanine ligase, partial [Lentisphaeria bacterium]|nr:D-alanine--D-alanine ligase [Lentisphaeria bacterium]